MRIAMKWLLLCSVMAGSVLLGGTAWAQDDTIVDPANAGRVYALQGEYRGQDDNGDVWGAQVIALGDGKFQLKGYPGGLPGDGWMRGGEVMESEAKLDGENVTAETAEWTAIVDGKTLTVFDPDGNQLISLQKVERKSPTLGASPPQGAIVLFDGSSADAFLNGKLTMGDLLEANCSTRKKFGDHRLHIEFRTPFKPSARGQARGNSGVYVQGRYEVQVLDSFGLKGENNECGGIYSISEPKVNMCFPPLTWQTYDIDFTAAKYDESGKKTENARITVKHNGVVIHENLELPHGTPGRHAEGPGPEELYLQGHGNPVVYRNIWVVEK